MATHRKSTTPSQGNPTAGVGADPSQGQYQQQEPPEMGRPDPTQGQGGGRFDQHREGMGSINRLFARGGTGGQSDARSAHVLKAFTDAKGELVESQEVTDNFEIVRMDRNQVQVGLGSILVMRRVQYQNTNYAVVRPLVVDTDAVNLPPQRIQRGMERLELATLPSDVFNEAYWNRLCDFLGNSVGLSRNELVVINAGPVTIPSDFPLDDGMKVKNLLLDSVNRVGDMVAEIQGEAPFNIAMIKNEHEEFSARINHTGETRYLVTDMPVRSDLHIQLSRRLRNQGNEATDLYYDSETAICGVSGFVNLDYVMPEPAQQFGGWQQQQVQQPKPFRPVIVVTDVSQADWIEMMTPEMYLLGLDNAYRMTSGNAWAAAFLPRTGVSGDGVDTRDIGALGYLGPMQKKLDTKTEDFSEQQLGAFLGEMVETHPAFVIDIDPMGPHSSVESLFIEAAYGQGQSAQQANQELIQAADNLTDGNFRQIYDETQRVVDPYNQTINIGWYRDKHGEKRDIRDLDLLAVLNLTKGVMSDFSKWWMTFVDHNEDPGVRLATREQLERNYLSQNLKIVSRAQRLALNPNFIMALNQATAKAGLQVLMDNVTNLYGTQRFYGNSVINNYAVTQNAQPFQRTGGIPGTGYNPGMGVGGRFHGPGGRRGF